MPLTCKNDGVASFSGSVSLSKQEPTRRPACLYWPTHLTPAPCNWRRRREVWSANSTLSARSAGRAQPATTGSPPPRLGRRAPQRREIGYTSRQRLSGGTVGERSPPRYPTTPRAGRTPAVTVSPAPAAPISSAVSPTSAASISTASVAPISTASVVVLLPQCPRAVRRRWHGVRHPRAQSKRREAQRGSDCAFGHDCLQIHHATPLVQLFCSSCL
ncbi:MAG: hypothetical protein JWR32_5386 [Mycobacterium sp.]|nr:hypothetical protein [Mycobacterium sp.]